MKGISSGVYKIRYAYCMINTNKNKGIAMRYKNRINWGPIKNLD